MYVAALLSFVAVSSAGAMLCMEARPGKVALPTALPPGHYTPKTESESKIPPARANRLREATLGRARVWHRPPRPIGQADLLNNPSGRGKNDPVASGEVACKFLPDEASGTTPKFDCVLPEGEALKVKYGHNSEIPAELAAARLLAALGFGADRMYLVRRLRCFGCPRFPFNTIRVVDAVKLGEAYRERIDFTRYVDFDWVAVERRFEGRSIAAGETGEKGWAWYELAEIEPSRGGASRAEVDAFRLMAVFLAHWDNKAENQRLVCLPGAAARNGSCRRPFAILQDAGATFGPRKVSLRDWKATPIWTDPARCLVSLKSLPYDGGTFKDAVISEAGRRFLARLLTQLSDAQVRNLFVGARFGEYDGDADGWLAAFKDKVRQVADRPPCKS